MISIYTRIYKRGFCLFFFFTGQEGELSLLFLPCKLSVPYALTTDISIIWHNGRDQECRKFKTAAKTEILLVYFCHAERETLVEE